MFTLGELADCLDLTFSGDAGRILTGLAPLADAGPEDLSFLADDRHLAHLRSTRAGAVILCPEHAAHCPADQLLCAEPYLAFARVSQLFDPAPAPEAGIHPSAVVDAGARVDPSATIGPHAVVEAGAVVSAGVVLAAGVFLGRDAVIGAASLVHPGAVIHHGVVIGARCIVHSQAVIGGDGFGFARGPQGWEKIRQLGGVQIGDDVEIGSGSTIDRGTLGVTLIEDGVIIDNQVQVGHNCRIGKNTAIAGCVGLAGSTIIGRNCTLAGGVGVVGHLEICDDVHVTAMSMVTRSITRPGSYSSGTPMTRTAQWKRSAVRFTQLESIQRRLAALEKNR